MQARRWARGDASGPGAPARWVRAPQEHAANTCEGLGLHTQYTSGMCQPSTCPTGGHGSPGNKRRRMGPPRMPNPKPAGQTMTRWSSKPKDPCPFSAGALRISCGGAGGDGGSGEPPPRCQSRAGVTQGGRGRAGKLKAAAMIEGALDEWLDDALLARALPDARRGPQRIVVPSSSASSSIAAALSSPARSRPPRVIMGAARAEHAHAPDLLVSSHAWHRTATLAAQYVNCACNNHLLHASCTLCTAKAHGTAVSKVVSR